MPNLSQIEQVYWGQFLLFQERERLERAYFAFGGWIAHPLQVVDLKEARCTSTR